MLLRVLDTETTGLPPNAAVCQIGWCDVIMTHGDGARVDWPRQMFINPGRPIPPEARAVHHISDRDVANGPPPDVGFQKLMEGPPDVFVAHNAVFDRNFFGGGDRPWICTRKIAMRLWPDAPNHQNQTLRYYLGIDEKYDFEPAAAMPPHAAGPDTYITAHLIAEALEVQTVDQLIKWSNEPSLLPGAIQFGKHRGTPWPQVDPSYLDWMVRQADMDEDVRFTARHWINRRRADAR
jgi:exodeoxyribonuclease X